MNLPPKMSPPTPTSNTLPPTTVTLKCSSCSCTSPHLKPEPTVTTLRSPSYSTLLKPRRLIRTPPSMFAASGEGGDRQIGSRIWYCSFGVVLPLLQEHLNYRAGRCKLEFCLLYRTFTRQVIILKSAFSGNIPIVESQFRIALLTWQVEV